MPDWLRRLVGRRGASAPPQIQEADEPDTADSKDRGPPGGDPARRLDAAQRRLKQTISPPEDEAPE